MKMQIEGVNEDIPLDTIKGTKFSIESNPEAFKILSSQLYSNKPLAIIRELACNALDSNVAANSDRPFDVIIDNNSLIIRDYGLGLTEDQMNQVYTSYFNSTKGNTNNQIGGLGLGSKSPFSYTKKFHIYSYTGVTKAAYTAVLHQGMPVLQTGLVIPCTKPKGVEIIIPLAREDRVNFMLAAEKALLFFPKNTYSTSNNIIVKKREYYVTLEEGKVYALAKNTDYTRSGITRVIMGPVAYDVDTDKLSTAIQDNHKDLFKIRNLELFLPVGSVEVAASREGLSYDPHSLDILDKAFTDVSARMGSVIQDKINKAPDYFTAQLTYFGLNVYIRDTIKSTRISWQNRTVINTIAVNSLMNNTQSFAVVTDTVLKRKNMNVSWTTNFNNTASTFKMKPIIIFKDTFVGSFNKIIWHNKKHLNENTILCRGDLFDLYGLCAVFDIDPTKKCTVHSSHGVVNVSEMEAPAKPIRIKRINTQGKVVKRVAKADQAFSYKCTSITNLPFAITRNDSTKSLIYSELDPTQYVYITSNGKYTDLADIGLKNNFFNYLTDSIIKKPDTIFDYTSAKVIIIPKTHIGVIKSNSIPSVNESIASNMLKLVNDTEFNKMLAAAYVYNDPDTSPDITNLMVYIASMLLNNIKYLSDSALLNSKDISLFVLIATYYKHNNLNELFDKHNFIQAPMLKVYKQGLIHALKTFQKNYPLFSGTFIESRYSAKDIKQYSDYFTTKKELFSLQETLKDD